MRVICDNIDMTASKCLASDSVHMNFDLSPYCYDSDKIPPPNNKSWYLLWKFDDDPGSQSDVSAVR